MNFKGFPSKTKTGDPQHENNEDEDDYSQDEEEYSNFEGVSQNGNKSKGGVKELVKQDATNDSYSADSAGFEDDVSHKVMSKPSKKEAPAKEVVGKNKSLPSSKKGKDDDEYSEDDYSDMSAPEKMGVSSSRPNK